MRRPLYVFALTLFATVAVLLATNVGYACCAVLLGGAALVFILCVRALRRLSVLTVIALAVLCGSLLLYTYQRIAVSPIENLADTEHKAVLRITQLPSDGGKLYTASVVSSDTLSVGTRLCVSFAQTDGAIRLYDEAEGTFSLYAPSNNNRYLYGDGIYILAYAESLPKVTAGNGAWYQRLADGLRDKMLAAIHTVLPGNEGDFLAGICLGETDALSDAITADFQESGLSHLLVVSGLHMTVLAGAVHQLTRLLKIKRRFTLVITLMCIWLFMLMVGFTYSVIRAAVMLHILLIGQTLRVRADARTSLATALSLIMLQNPYAVRDVGFLLSFAATLGLIVFSPLAVRLCDTFAVIRTHRWLRTLVLALCTPLAALTFTLPICAYVFGAFSVLSPLANVLAVYPTTIALCCGLLGGLFCIFPFGSLLAKGVFFVAGLVSKWVLAVAHGIALVSVAQLQLRYAVIPVLCAIIPLTAYYAYLLYGRVGLRRAAVSGVALLMLCTVSLTLFTRNTVTVRVADSENDLVTVIETADCNMAIVSGGSHDAWMSAKRYVCGCGLGALDVLVVTAGDMTVTASLADFLEAIPADTVVYATDGEDYTAGIADITRYAVTDAAAFTFGENRTLETINGWWRLRFGETYIVLASDDANASLLPQTWRQMHLAVLYGDVPKGVSLLETRRAVFSCSPNTVRYHTMELPWGRYPIHLTATNGEMVLCTTERGDFADAGRLYL